MAVMVLMVEAGVVELSPLNTPMATLKVTSWPMEVMAMAMGNMVQLELSTLPRILTPFHQIERLVFSDIHV